MEGLEGLRGRAGLGAQRVGRAAEEVGQHPAGGDRQVGARGRPAVAADEAVGPAVVGEGAFRRQRPAAGGAPVERRVEPVELQQPGLEIPSQQLRARALLGRLHDGQGQPVDLLLGLALGRERVQQLGAAREEERRVEAARARTEGRVQQLRLAEPEEVRTLPAVQGDPHLGQRFEGRLVARPAAAGPASHRTHLPSLPREQDNHFARFAQIEAPENQGLSSEKGHWRVATAPQTRLS